MKFREKLTDTFSRAALGTARGIRGAFARAALTKPGQVSVRHAGVIGSLSFFAGDIVYGIKHLAPAVAFIVADACLAASDYVHNKSLQKILKHAVPAAGVATLVGTALMVHAGWDEPGRWALLTSCSMIGLQATTMIWQNRIHNLAARMSKSSSAMLSKIFTPLAKYPLLTTTITDLVGKGIMAIGAIQQKDLRFIFATALWSNGDGGLICKDENVIKWLDEKKAAKAAPADAPAPRPTALS